MNVLRNISFIARVAWLNNAYQSDFPKEIFKKKKFKSPSKEFHH